MRLISRKVSRKLSPVLVFGGNVVVLHGGRGSGKSWVVAEKLILKAAESRRLILCAREVMVSIEDSVHALLVDTIYRLGMEDEFEILKTEITHIVTGSRFIYAGIKTHPRKVKGLEGVTDLWVEEAEAVSEESWQIVLPTVGRTVPNPQVFVVFNPYSDGDATTVRFLKHPPEGALVIEVNWWDNPWFPEWLRKQKDDDYARDPAAARHIWEGKTIEESGTTEFDMTALKTFEPGRLDGINWYLCVDPSGSKKKENGDFSVFAAVGMGKDRNVYVGEWVRDRMDLGQKYATMVRLHEKYRFKAIGYEDSAGGLEVDYFDRKGAETNYRLPILPLKNTKAKEERIRWLVPLVSERRFYIPEDCPYTQLDGVRLDLSQAFRKEMTSFPHISAALHDDMLDATSRIMDPDLGANWASASPAPNRPPQRGRYDPATRRMIK